MAHVETVFTVEAYGDRCEDRVAFFASEERTVIVVADGAGGIGYGATAAESVVREIQSEHEGVHFADQWAERLEQIDGRISVGEATAVVVDVRPSGIAGASVGDTQAWSIHDGDILDLTRNQNRKPLLGSGEAHAVSFTHPPLQGVLLIGTDGFFDYAKRDNITKMIARTEFYSIPQKCVDMVRLPSGDLWDDIGVVAVRNTPVRRTRERYSI